MMDWQANEGEEFEGVINYSEEEDAPEGLVRFGAVGADEIRANDDARSDCPAEHGRCLHLSVTERDDASSCSAAQR